MEKHRRAGYSHFNTRNSFQHNDDHLTPNVSLWVNFENSGTNIFNTVHCRVQALMNGKTNPVLPTHSCIITPCLLLFHWCFPHHFALIWLLKCFYIDWQTKGHWCQNKLHFAFKLWLYLLQIIKPLRTIGLSWTDGVCFFILTMFAIPVKGQKSLFSHSWTQTERNISPCSPPVWSKQYPTLL